MWYFPISYYGDTYSYNYDACFWYIDASWDCQVGNPVPRPRPALHFLQYGKGGRAWYLSHYVIGKWWEFAELTGCISRIVQLTTSSTLCACVLYSPPTSSICVVSYNFLKSIPRSCFMPPYFQAFRVDQLEWQCHIRISCVVSIS